MEVVAADMVMSKSVRHAVSLTYILYALCYFENKNKFNPSLNFVDRPPIFMKAPYKFTVERPTIGQSLGFIRVISYQYNIYTKIIG